MKQIKKIVLKSATELTNSEMKKLRGGYDPGNDHSAVCTVQCPAEFGGSSVELDCLNY
ncbi:MAG: TIGR04149 family rSAM-modified RiPP, partial [Bacteroidaceae bacterium]|nr:TIGR04149 family rSAM-modified RiPP [Bacteroidaceae bacterium]